MKIKNRWILAYLECRDTLVSTVCGLSGLVKMSQLFCKVSIQIAIILFYFCCAVKVDGRKFHITVTVL